MLNPDMHEYLKLRKLAGITSGISHGHADSIASIVNTWNPDVESMEGGAFFYACLSAEVPFLEIRAVSNLVEPRNRDAWDIPLATKNLCDTVGELLNTFI
jgi:futalosine hydrolase